jgi:hypothetical protein
MDTTPEPHAASATQPPAQRRCENCGAQLLGEHCYACGQPTKGLVRHFGSILGDFFDSVLNLDTRTVRTLPPLLFKPGYLSLEYFHGHRVRYVSPVRLFFFLCIAAIFAVTLVFDFDEQGVPRGDERIANAQTVAEAEKYRDDAIAALARARDAIPDTPGARVGMEVGIQLVKDQAAERIAWLQERDAAIREGRPIPPWETGADAPDADDEPAAVDVQRAADGSAAPDDASPRRRGLRVRTDEMQFNDRPWDPVTNPLTFDWLGERGNGWLNALVGRVQDNVRAIEKKPRLLVDAFFGGLPQTLLVLLPVFALLLKIMYLFKRRLYMEHLIVALHSHAFLCAALLVMVGVYALREQTGPGLLHGALGWAELAICLWMPLYLLLMQKRVYRQGWFFTSLKFVILGTCYVVLLAVGAMLNLAVSLVAM